MDLVLFPNQLFAQLHSKNIKNIYLIEEPLYFYDPDLRPLKYHKAKLAYLVTCMRSYASKHKNIKYVPYDAVPAFYTDMKNRNIIMYDPMDHDVISKYAKIAKTITILPTPNFILKDEDLEVFHTPNINKRILHSTFYGFVKKKLNLLVNQPSMDKENRKPLPASIKLTNTTKVFKSAYHIHAIEYVNKMWPGNPGSFEGLQTWPTTHSQAQQHLKGFLESRFREYGTYQDAIDPTNSYLYHSTISPVLNIGLLNPTQVLNATLSYAEGHAIPMNSLEGFVRQLIGWREYMRYLYVYHHNDYMKQSIPSSKKKRIKDWSQWYEGKTQFPIVNNEITKLISETGGYAHHIIRLMVFLNIFILLEIHPEDIYKWFMEVCAIDAYDWVMKPNIWCMGYFYTRATSKQYICTSNYINTMSSNRYKRDANWDALFHKYIKRYRPSAYLRNIKS